MEIEIDGVTWDVERNETVEGGQIRHNPVFGTVRVTCSKTDGLFNTSKYDLQKHQLFYRQYSDRHKSTFTTFGQTAKDVSDVYPYLLIKKI